MDTLRTAWAIFAKDLVSERRTKDVSNAILLFGFTVAVSFTFAFEPTTEEARKIAGGLLWLAFLFASLLGLNRSFARELSNDCLQALRLIPADLGAIYLGKLLSNLLFMVLAEAVLLPVFGIFFNLSLWERPFWLAAILVLGTWGIAALGTMFSAVSANTRMRELMLPMLLLPLTIPLLIAAMASTTTLLMGAPMQEADVWLKLLLGFDIIFTVLCWLLFDTVVQE
jgi:heme exporter protein B